MGRVLETFTDKLGRTRTVRIKTKNSAFLRPVFKLRLIVKANEIAKNLFPLTSFVLTLFYVKSKSMRTVSFCVSKQQRWKLKPKPKPENPVLKEI